MSREPYEPNDVRGQERTASTEERTRDYLRKIEREDIAWLAHQPRGRRILWRFLPAGDPFDGNALNMARNLGEQKSGRDLERLLKDHCLEDYFQMIRENNDESADATG